MKKIKKYFLITMIISCLQSYLLTMNQGPNKAYILHIDISKKLTQEEEEIEITRRILLENKEHKLKQYTVPNLLGLPREILVGDFKNFSDKPKLFLKSTTRRENDTITEVEHNHPLYTPALRQVLAQQTPQKPITQKIPSKIYTNAVQLHQGITNGDDTSNAQVHCIIS